MRISTPRVCSDGSFAAVRGFAANVFVVDACAVGAVEVVDVTRLLGLGHLAMASRDAFVFDVDFGLRGTADDHGTAFQCEHDPHLYRQDRDRWTRRFPGFERPRGGWIDEGIVFVHGRDSQNHIGACEKITQKDRTRS